MNLPQRISTKRAAYRSADFSSVIEMQGDSYENTLDYWLNPLREGYCLAVVTF